jgi:hypothetical protein
VKLLQKKNIVIIIQNILFIKIVFLLSFFSKKTLVMIKDFLEQFLFFPNKDIKIRVKTTGTTTY